MIAKQRHDPHSMAAAQAWREGRFDKDSKLVPWTLMFLLITENDPSIQNSFIHPSFH